MVSVLLAFFYYESLSLVATIVIVLLTGVLVVSCAGV